MASIFFYDAQDKFVGSMRFYKEGQPVPANTERTDTTPTRVYLTASENQIPLVVDMLRNEKPCYVYYSSPTNAYVKTGLEEVGEEET